MLKTIVTNPAWRPSATSAARNADYWRASGHPVLSGDAGRPDGTEFERADWIAGMPRNYLVHADERITVVDEGRGSWSREMFEIELSYEYEATHFGEPYYPMMSTNCWCRDYDGHPGDDEDCRSAPDCYAPRFDRPLADQPLPEF